MPSSAPTPTVTSPATPGIAPSAAAVHPSVGGFAIVIIAASLFGMLGPLSRFAYDDGMAPLAFVAWRGAIGLVATVVFVAWRIRRGSEALTRVSELDRTARLSLALAALVGFTLNLAMFIAFDLVTVALALLGFYTYPVMVAVVNVASGRESLDRPRMVALTLAVAGMIAVSTTSRAGAIVPICGNFRRTSGFGTTRSGTFSIGPSTFGAVTAGAGWIMAPGFGAGV
jgi:DME family drug/metabolite transporter